MIDGLEHDHDFLLRKLASQLPKDFQCIVTTRPGYVSKDIQISRSSISLLHFDSSQRTQWINQYTSNEGCAQYVSPEILRYIREIGANQTSGICDTPMTLYMLVAKPDSYKYLNNAWSLYNYIFGSALSQTEYNAMIHDPNGRYAHGIEALQEALYRVSEELAYRMYQSKSKPIYLDDSAIADIVKQISKDLPILEAAKMRTITEKCYSLCCYWRGISNKLEDENGAVEFRHNNIRDFFLAEKIYREMNIVYKSVAKKLKAKHLSKSQRF